MRVSRIASLLPLLLLVAAPAAALEVHVTSPSNSGAGSLRSAIEQVNGAGAGPHTIIVDALSGPIRLITPLPPVSVAVTIDASGTVADGGVPTVVLDGASLVGATGLELVGGASTVRGISIVNFSNGGILVRTRGGNRVEGCWIGVTPAGAAAGNGRFGVSIVGVPDNVVGGTTPLSRNIISANDDFGVVISGDGATNNDITGNYIGVGTLGRTALGNGDAGVRLDGAPGNVVERNVISANGEDGVQLGD
ncbi:MAG: right-handed parallel beta-helix repeat-containing protein, partial [Myxococcales bacterium]|nr:right-handed parallel beta-helix repeat-containing protein [Myxococcales bacterium]